MQCRILIAISFIDTHPSFNQQPAIFQLIGLGSNMQRSLIEISQRIDIYLFISNDPLDNGRSVVHGSVVYDSPIALKPIVDVDGKMRGFVIKMREEDFRLIFEYTLQEMFMQFVVFFVVGLPYGLAIRRILLLLFQSVEIVDIANLLVGVLLIRMQMFHGVDHRFEVGLLQGVL